MLLQRDKNGDDDDGNDDDGNDDDGNDDDDDDGNGIRSRRQHVAVHRW